MIRFRTPIEIPKAPFELKTDRSVLFIGSCFSDNIGARLRDCMAPVNVNPCGVQFNPASIARVISRSLDGDSLHNDTFFYYDGMWRCWLMPSAFADVDKSKVYAKTSEALTSLRESITGAQALVITFGTAQVYRRIATPLSDFKGVVSNCHKAPAREFSHEMLSVSEITDEWRRLVGRLCELNSSLRIIFTVSPVRHLNPSPRLNTLSKSILHIATDELIRLFPEQTFYFPAWELLMDDLRDYRFYADDLVHPSDMAITYIFERFCETFYSESARQILMEGERKHRRLNHRPFRTT